MQSDNGKVFKTICNGEIEIQSLTAKDLNQTIEILNKSFYPNECVCRGTEINLPESTAAREELSELCRLTAEDGISLIAKHLPSNQVVGVLFNKIQWSVKPNEETFFEEFIRTKCKSPNGISLMEYMSSMDSKLNIFDYYKIDCLLEMVFLGTLQEFCGRGIGLALVQTSIELARSLLNGENLNMLNDKLKDKRPKAVSALFTSIYSQKIGKRAGMEFLIDVPYTEYKYNGKTYAERIGPLHPSGILCAKKFDYEIRFLTTDDVEESINVLRNSFFLNENICRATDICLPESIEAKNELERFGRILLEDGISLIAKHVQTNKIVAVAFNTIQYPPNNEDEAFLENFSKTVKTSNMKAIMHWLKTMETKYDVFKNLNIDCVFEIMFLATLPEFEKKGIGRALAIQSIQYAKELSKGIGVEDLNDKLKDKRPKAVTALFTSNYSQKIGKSLGFEILLEVPYTEFSYNGTSFADKIGPLHRTVTISALKL